MGYPLTLSKKRRRHAASSLSPPPAPALPAPRLPTHPGLHPRSQAQSSELTAGGHLMVRTDESPGHGSIPQCERRNQQAPAWSAEYCFRGRAPASVGSSYACAGDQTCGAGLRFVGSRRSRLLLPGRSHGGGKFKPCQSRGVL